MWSALHTSLRELFAGLSPQARFWLAVVIIMALLALAITVIVTRLDLAPFLGLLGA